MAARQPRVLAPHYRADDVCGMSQRENSIPTPTTTLPRERGRARTGHTPQGLRPDAGPPALAGEGRAGSSPRPAPSRAWSHPGDIADRVLYRDGLVLVIDKPAGIPVHAGPGGGANLEHWFPLLRFGLPRPPGLAHRLDRDTSGCLVLGRHPKALRRLGRLFAEGRVEKVYWAVVAGSPSRPEGRIDLALAKQARGTVGWRMMADPAGQQAVTDYRVLGAADGRAWLELRPRTGRTHQVRVHCAALGCPIIGDPTYGGPGGETLQLHARAIALPLYPAKPPIAVTAPVPPHMLALLRRLGYDPHRGAPSGAAPETIGEAFPA